MAHTIRKGSLAAEIHQAAHRWLQEAMVLERLARLQPGRAGELLRRAKESRAAAARRLGRVGVAT